ncbi:MerR family transcriptional regulator [Fodinicola acaciae]|uniref:MerR family transcriptional regulator n=1 Tax=Fodinicola acaciae TaxID=2681555 RepID=UPI0013D5E2CD|nr:MerR family transcriptional regulator [Fodinicola acaciae]
MRIAELSRQSGVPVPTIKYYLREGLLPSGELTSPNQAQYDDTHLRRLRLIRALLDIGGLSIGLVREVLVAMETPDKPVHDVLGVVQRTITPPRAVNDEHRGWADERVAELVSRRGWDARPVDPSWRALSEVLMTLRQVDADGVLALLDDYSKIAEDIAAVDVRSLIHRRSGTESVIEGMVVGTVLGDALLSALRRMAQQNESSRYFGKKVVAG